MKSRIWILFIVGLTLMVGGAATLLHFKSRQHLGRPGLKYSEIAGDVRVQIELPLDVAGYTATSHEPEEMVVNTLPPDTSMARVDYDDASKNRIYVNTVMMGTDRTSIHKPEICLPGQGFNIDNDRTSSETVQIGGTQPYDLPVKKVIASRMIEVDGQRVEISGVYVYWFVADGAVTEDHNQRMWWMAKHLLETGELQRWAYVSYFSVCNVGGEEAAFEKIKRLISMTVPKFQLTRPMANPAPSAQ